MALFPVLPVHRMLQVSRLQFLPESTISFLPVRRRRDDPITKIPDGYKLAKQLPGAFIGSQLPMDPRLLRRIGFS
jgi:hypothetical protein